MVTTGMRVPATQGTPFMIARSTTTRSTVLTVPPPSRSRPWLGDPGRVELDSLRGREPATDVDNCFPWVRVPDASVAP